MEDIQKLIEETFTESDWDYFYHSDANEVVEKAFRAGYEAAKKQDGETVGKMIDELEAKLKRAEDNLAAIADVFVNAPTMRLEAKKCLEFINPEKYGKKYGIAPYTP